MGLAMSDLINRLRHVAWLAEEGSEVTDLALEAGDAIGRLRAEVERLTADIDEDLWIKKWPIAKENAALRAEVERLTDEMSTMHRSVVHQCCEDVQAERALADQLAEELRANHDTSNPTSVECPSCVALTAYEAQRGEGQ